MSYYFGYLMHMIVINIYFFNDDDDDNNFSILVFQTLVFNM